MSGLKVTIDEAKCVGAGQCVIAAPKVFDQRDEDGIVVLLDATPDETQTAAVKKAERLCPAMAIRLSAA